MGPSTRAITIVTQMQNHFQAGVVDGFEFTMTITAVDSFADIYLFRYEQIPATTVGGSIINRFNGVCSPVDLQEFPVGAPDVDANPAFFRAASIDLVFRTRSQGEEAYEAIKEDLARLIQSQNIMDDLGSPVTEIIGPFPEV